MPHVKPEYAVKLLERRSQGFKRKPSKYYTFVMLVL
jgi:hypothetical protein